MKRNMGHLITTVPLAAAAMAMTNAATIAAMTTTLATGAAGTATATAIDTSAQAAAQAQAQVLPLAQDPGGPLALKGRLIDGTGAPALERSVVVIEGGKIRCAGAEESCRIPRGARVIDAGAGTILPGLIDLHAHIWDPSMFSMFLPAGVTTVRDLHNSFEGLATLDDVTAPGPRLFRAGPLIDGPQPRWPGTLTAATPAEARAAVDSVLDSGVDFVKLYTGLSPESYAAAAARVRERGGRATTDILQSEVDALQALAAGVEGFEHASGFWLAYRRLGGDPTRSPLDPVLLDSLARAVVRHNAYLVPTLIVQHQFATEGEPSLKGVPLADRVSELIRGFWKGGDAIPAQAKAYFAHHERFSKALVRRIVELGGRVGAGSDIPNPYVTPGGALHQELELLVEAGLTPLQAIRTATGGAGEILGRGDLGVLAPGREADLIVVAGNPAREIRATRDVRWVVRGGQLLSVDTLLALAPPVRGSTPAALGDASPRADAERLRAGVVVYDVQINGAVVGVDTVRIERGAAGVVISDRLRSSMMSQEVETNLAPTTLVLRRTRVVQEMSGNRIEVELAVEGERLIGRLILPPAFGGTVPVDVAFPAGSAEAISLGPVVAGLPLESGNTWTIPAYNSMARAVVPYRIGVGALEAVPVGSGEVRAFAVTVETSGFQQKLWISESLPRWVVASETPAFGLRLVARDLPR